MLTNKKNIDQLFQEKLGDYEKNPPFYLWKNIQGNLDQQRKIKRLAWFRRAAVAAVVVMAFLAGWMMTQTSSLPEQQQAGNYETHQQVPAVTAPADPVTSNETVAADPLKSLATFAPPRIAISKSETIEKTASGDFILSETEEELLNSFKPKKDVIEQVANWVKSFTDNSEPIDTVPVAIKKEPVYTAREQRDIPQPQTTLNTPGKASQQRLRIKGEISPLFTSSEKIPSGSNGSDYQSNETLSGGMTASYKVAKNFSVKSGLLFAKMNQSTRNTPFVPVNGDYLSMAPPREKAKMMAGQVMVKTFSDRLAAQAPGGGENSYFMYNNDISQEISYLEIPVAATYQLGEKKFHVGLSGGMSANVLVGNRATISENGTRVASGATADLRDVVLSGSAGIEFGYDITDRITISVEPRVKRYLHSISKNDAVNFNPSQFGIYTGLSYKFN